MSTEPNRRDVAISLGATGALAIAEPAPAAAASDAMDADHAQLITTALDYIQGFYTADSERMERAIHPELAKRILRRDADGRRFPAAARADVVILDKFENAACVRIDAATWVDFLHLVRVSGQWKIINVLWEMRPT